MKPALLERLEREAWVREHPEEYYQEQVSAAFSWLGERPVIERLLLFTHDGYGRPLRALDIRKIARNGLEVT